MTEYTTCKLVFPVDTAEEKVKEVVAKNTNNRGKVHNYYANKKIGRNNIAFAVVDIPIGTEVNFADDRDVTGLDLMLNVIIPKRGASDCCPPSSGG